MRISFIISALAFFISSTFSHAASGKWEIIDSTCVLYDNVPYGIWNKAIDCADSNNCITIGNRGWKSPWNRVTMDGGKTWNTTLEDTMEYTDDYIVLYNPSRANELSYPDTNFCIIVCDTGYYWLSRDKCRTWKRYSLNTDKFLTQVNFHNEKFGGIIVYNGLFLTYNSGEDWTYIDDTAFSDSIENNYYIDVSIPDTSTIISLLWRKDKSNMIIRSEDKGITWERYYVGGPRVNKLYFLNKDLGWAAGRQQIAEDSPMYRDIIMKTTDGGRTWSLQLDSLCKNKAGLRQIYFADELHGAALGEWWDLWKTSDGGETWLSDDTYNRNTVRKYFSDIELIHSTDVILGVSMDFLSVYKFTAEPDEVNEINGYKSDHTLKLYPNPVFSGSPINITFNIYCPSALEFRTYNSLGELMDEPFRLFGEAGGHTLSYTPGRDFAPGVYFVKMIVDGGEAVTGSFVVE